MHVDLCEWVFIDWEWRLAYEVVPLQDEAEVADEIQRQYERFRELVEGSRPTSIRISIFISGIRCGLI